MDHLEISIDPMACQVCHYKNLQYQPTLQTSYATVWTNHIVMKNCFQQQTNRIALHENNRSLDKSKRIALIASIKQIVS